MSLELIDVEDVKNILPNIFVLFVIQRVFLVQKYNFWHSVHQYVSMDLISRIPSRQLVRMYKSFR